MRVGVLIGTFTALLVTATNVHARKAPPPPPPMAAGTPWLLRLPAEQKVPFRGVVNYDEAGIGTGTILYPAVDPLSFLVAIATHGIMNESMKSGQKSKIQEQADKILEPYQPVLDRYTYRELMERGLAGSVAGADGRLAEPNEQAAAEWILDVAPIFSVTQDQRAIILDNVVALYAPGNAKTPAYANSVRVVSTPKAETDVPVLWTSNDGAILKEESAVLFAQSIDAFLDDVTATKSADAPKYKTVRYPQGGVENIERAQLVAEICGRATLKTLRGWLMSVPAQVGGTPCLAPAPMASTLESATEAPAAIPETAPPPTANPMALSGT